MLPQGPSDVSNVGFGVWGLGFLSASLFSGFRVQGLGFRIWSWAVRGRVQGFKGLGLRGGFIEGFRFHALGASGLGGSEVQGLGPVFRVWV